MNDSFLFYRSWIDSIKEEYEDAETRKSLIYAIMEYGIYGVKTFPCERLFLKQAYFQIDSAKAKWDDIRQKRSEAGRKGGKAGSGESKARYGNKNAKKENTQANASKHNHNVNVNGNVNVNDNDNANDNVNDNMPFDCAYSLTEDTSKDPWAWLEADEYV